MNPSVFISYPRALLTGLSLPMEMISSARTIARIEHRSKVNWNCLVVSPTFNSIEPIQFANGMTLLPSHNLKTVPDPSHIFVPPIWGNPDKIGRAHV